MKKILLTGLILSFSLNFYAQTVYQASVNQGFGLKVGLLLDMWKADVVVDNSVLTTGINLGMEFGITENIMVFGNYQYAFKSTIKDNKELKYLISNYSVQHQNFNAGLQYNLGSTLSQWRYNFLLGAFFARTTNGVQSDVDDIVLDINLDGLGLIAGGGIDYYIYPHLSLTVELQYVGGVFLRSEFVGITYKEELNFSRFQTILGLTYHFGGR